MRRNDGSQPKPSHLGIETAVSFGYNLASDSTIIANQGSAAVGDFLDFLAEAGTGFVWAILLLAFVAFTAYVIYRFYKATISTIYLVSEIVILGLFLTPITSLFALLGNLLDSILPISSIFTAVGALIGFIVGIYLWLQFH